MSRSVCCLVGAGVLVALAVFLSAPFARPARSDWTGSRRRRRRKRRQPPRGRRARRLPSARRRPSSSRRSRRATPGPPPPRGPRTGEYIAADGTIIRGRAAIEAAYTKAFGKNKKLEVKFTIDSIRFPSKDTAVEEGYAQAYRGGSDQPTASRYSVLHVREGGRWLMAMLREWPDEGVSLDDLDWLIGTWEAKTDECRSCAPPTSGTPGRTPSAAASPSRETARRFRPAGPAEGPADGAAALVAVRRRGRLRRRRLDAGRQALGDRGDRGPGRRRGGDGDQHPHAGR